MIFSIFFIELLTRYICGIAINLFIYNQGHQEDL